MTQSWIHRVEGVLANWVSRGFGSSWVVAVSGGGDSVGMLRILHAVADRLNLHLSIAHLDHGARGEASRADADFVAELAGSLGLPLDLGQWRPSRVSHFEADARRARYDWLTEIARARQASVVAVGHTRDDQAETILHRIIRGTGTKGLAGIPRTRRLASEPVITLARPLLAVSRSEIRDYLAAIVQPYREDQSNMDLSRTRARIRHDLMPRLAADYNPRVAEALARLGDLAAVFQKSMEAELRMLERSVVVTRTHDAIVFKRGVLGSIQSFLLVELFRRVWRRAGWPEAGMSAKRWRRMAALVRSAEVNKIDIGHHVNVSTDRSFLILRRSPPPGILVSSPDIERPIALEVPGGVRVPWAERRIEARLDLIEDGPGIELIDFDRVRFPLLVRAPRPGDRFEPLGMDGASRPLADFFRGRHIPRDERARTPLVCDQEGIILVVGHRIADRVKRTEQTRRTLGLVSTLDTC